MSETIKEIERLQAEYDALEAEGAAQFGTKARLLLEKQLRDEMKKRLDALGGDRDAFKARKSAVFQALHAAKIRRRDEIAAGVADGAIGVDAATAEIQSLGWESGVAKALIATALKQTSDHVTTAVGLPADESPAATGAVVSVDQYAGVSDADLRAMVAKHEQTLKSLPDAQAPNSREEAVSLLVRAGLTPEVTAPAAIETIAEPAADPGTVETPADPAPDANAPAPQHEEILDPVGAAQPVAQDVVYKETGKDDGPAKEKKKRK